MFLLSAMKYCSTFISIASMELSFFFDSKHYPRLVLYCSNSANSNIINMYLRRKNNVPTVLLTYFLVELFTILFWFHQLWSINVFFVSGN